MPVEERFQDLERARNLTAGVARPADECLRRLDEARAKRDGRQPRPLPLPASAHAPSGRQPPPALRDRVVQHLRITEGPPCGVHRIIDSMRRRLRIARQHMPQHVVEPRLAARVQQRPQRMRVLLQPLARAANDRLDLRRRPVRVLEHEARLAHGHAGDHDAVRRRRGPKLRLHAPHRYARSRSPPAPTHVHPRRPARRLDVLDAEAERGAERRREALDGREDDAGRPSDVGVVHLRSRAPTVRAHRLIECDQLRMHGDAEGERRRREPLPERRTLLRVTPEHGRWIEQTERHLEYDVRRHRRQRVQERDQRRHRGDSRHPPQQH